MSCWIHKVAPFSFSSASTLAFALGWIVIEIAREHQRPEFREAYEQRLVSRCMSRRRQDYHRSVVKNLMVAVEQQGLAVLSALNLAATSGAIGLAGDVSGNIAARSGPCTNHVDPANALALAE